MPHMIFPNEYLIRMQKMLDREDRAFFAALEEEPRKALRLNPLKSDKPADIVGSCPLHQNVPWESMGYCYDETFLAGKHPFHEAGVYYIQEPSAMAPVSFLDVTENLKILDLCAAPGGKSTQIAGKMMGTGILVSNEIVGKRAKILSENIERMGISNAIVTSESPDDLSVHFTDYFDRILVDAPCSGEGMFRKNSEAISEWSPENVSLCAKRQDEILDRADVMLKWGGRLVYSTCTFSPDEDEGTIARFLSRHPQYTLLDVEKYEGMEEGKAEFLSLTLQEDPAYDLFNDRKDPERSRGSELSRCVRIWPHKVEGEGHFLAVLYKGEPNLSENDNTVFKTNSKGGLVKGLSEKEIEPYLLFANNTFSNFGGKIINRIDFNTDNSVFIRFGDNLYRLPKDSMSLKGLKVERPGLHLGTFLKNRFEPAHALAHFLHMTDSVNVYNMPSDSAEVKMYLNGQALRPADTDGSTGYGLKISEGSPWILMCVEGFSLGWGKYAGGVIKNHYPKGLRIPF